MSERRPTQVSVASGLVVAGSLSAVLVAFVKASDVHSIKSQASIASYLSKPPGSSLGLSVQGAQELLIGAAVVTAVLAAATGVLGGFVLQRSRGSRLALSALAPPLVIAGLLSGGFASAIVAAATVMLWLEPSRSWVEGREAPARPQLPPRPDFPTAATRDLSALPPPRSAPIFPTAAPAPPAPTVPTAGPIRSIRPPAVVWACLVTWAVATFALLVFGQAMVTMVTDPQTLVHQLHQQNPDLAAEGMSDGNLRVAIWVMSSAVVGWSLLAAVLALLAWRRVRWAATGLLVSTALLGGLGLLMLRADVRRWYAARS